MIDDPFAEKILDESRRIDGFITELDRGWLRSANVRQFLLKHGDGSSSARKIRFRFLNVKEEDS